MNRRSSGTSICLANVLVSAVCVISEIFLADVGHGDEPSRTAAGLQRILGGPAAASAATNESDLNCLIFQPHELAEG